jgi:hypothetical protein
LKQVYLFLSYRENHTLWIVNDVTGKGSLGKTPRGLYSFCRGISPGKTPSKAVN